MHAMSSRLMMASAPVVPPDIISATTQNVANSATISVGRPTNSTTGDLLLLVAGTKDGASGRNWASPGWTEEIDAGVSPALLVGRKVWSSETDPIGTLTYDSTDSLTALCVAFRNAVWDLIGTPIYNKNTNQIVMPSITVTNSGTLLIAVVVRRRLPQVSNGVAGMSVLAEYTTYAPFVGIYYQNVGAGDTGAKTWSGTVNDNDEQAGVLLSIGRS